MNQSDLPVAEQIARAASAFEIQRTGHAPTGVTVVLSEDTLVITMRGVLSEVEKAMAKGREATALIQSFHRLLFSSTAEQLSQEISRITGADVCEAAAEVDLATGAAIHVFTTGTVVQVFLLGRRFPSATWSSHPVSAL